jgi:tetratricopeptide (TPR) repeat protein
VSNRRACKSRPRAAASLIVFALAAQVTFGQETPPSPPASEADAPPASDQGRHEPAAGIPAGFLEGSTSEFRRLLAAMEYEQAVTQARQLLEGAEQEPGPDSEYLQVALMNLALAQYLAGDYVGAETSYLRVVELVAASGHLISPRLARAQAGLATTYFAGKRYDLAVERYELAIALVRREQGLFAEEQIPLLENYADALVHVGRTEDAVRARRYILRAVERKYGAASLRYAQEFESLGRWFIKIGAYDVARASLRNAITIIENAQGEDAAELIGPLTALAECARRQLLDPSYARAASPDEQRQSMFHDTMPPIMPSLSPNTIASEGQSSLERAVAIAGAQVPPSPAQIADVRTLLGDWYQSRKRDEQGLSNYQLAWQAAGDTTVDGKPLTELLFGRPVQLVYSPPGSWNRYAGRPADEVVVHMAQLGFTVTADGHVVDPKVLTDGVDPKFAAQLTRAAQAAIYRPRLEKGVPVDTQGVTLEQPFYTLVANESEGSGDPAKPAELATADAAEPAADAAEPAADAAEPAAGPPDEEMPPPESVPGPGLAVPGG